MNPARGGNRSGGGGGGDSGGRSGRGGGRNNGSRGRSSQHVYREVSRPSPVVAHSNGVLPASGSSESDRRKSDTSSVDGVTEKRNDVLSSDRSSESNLLTHEDGNMSPTHFVSNPARGGNRNGGDGGGRSGRGGGRNNGSRGRSYPRVYREVSRPSPVVAHSNDVLPASGSSEANGRIFDTSSVDGVTEKLNDMWSSDHSPEPNILARGCGNTSPTHSKSDSKTVQELKLRDQDEENQTLSCLSSTPLPNADCQTSQESDRGKSSSEGTRGEVETGKYDTCDNCFSFDICAKIEKRPSLKPSLLTTNKAKRIENKRRTQGNNIETLRPGMFLLKGYISLTDQVKLIKACRDLGRGHGGFYEPGYRDGAKLNLRMMCLGKNWDPETNMYSDKRCADNAEPPPIPVEFQQMVKGAIQECHSYLESQSKKVNVREILPSMSPNLCIVNFYSRTGKLGLHQDKDESRESIHKGLPVVSFSLGDTAEFLYGEQRDIEAAEKVQLESGDVLIFGGKSRLIFHGVSSIKPDTAPEALLSETNLKPGRLNLTFREY